MVKVGKWIAKHRIFILLVSILLLIPAAIGKAETKINYDLLSYLPGDLETVKGQDILVDEYGMGAFSMVVVEGMELKDVQKLEEKFSEVDHVKDVMWYDDVADISLPVEMIPKDLRKAFFNGDATMMLALFDNTTSSDEAMEAVTNMRKIADKQCFISGMTGIVTDIKNISLQELPIYVVIATLLSFFVLELTGTSFLVPIFFLISIGAAVLYNLGSNIFLRGIAGFPHLTDLLPLCNCLHHSLILQRRFEVYGFHLSVSAHLGQTPHSWIQVSVYLPITGQNRLPAEVPHLPSHLKNFSAYRNLSRFSSQHRQEDLTMQL